MKLVTIKNAHKVLMSEGVAVSYDNLIRYVKNGYVPSYRITATRWKLDADTIARDLTDFLRQRSFDGRKDRTSSYQQR